MTKANSADPLNSAQRIENDLETRYSVSEAVGLFASEDELERVILALQEHGVDRSRISVLGHLPTKKKAGQIRSWMRHLVDLEDAPHGTPSDRATLAEAETAVVALPGYGGAMVGLIAVMASGGALGLAVASAIFAGAVGSGAGYLLARSIDRQHGEEVRGQLDAGGLVLWVTLEDDDEAILGMLRQSGGTNVHVAKREGRWGPEDIPLSTGQPDPFL